MPLRYVDGLVVKSRTFRVQKYVIFSPVEVTRKFQKNLCHFDTEKVKHVESFMVLQNFRERLPKRLSEISGPVSPASKIYVLALAGSINYFLSGGRQCWIIPFPQYHLITIERHSTILVTRR